MRREVHQSGLQAEGALFCVNSVPCMQDKMLYHVQVECALFCVHVVSCMLLAVAYASRRYVVTYLQ